MPVKLNYQVFGEGRPVYILHGLFGSNRNWAGIARELSTGFQVVTVDLRNHGKSDHSDSMNYSDIADDVRFLAVELDHDKINLIGHSMGGKTAMTLALLFPTMIERLIVVDIAPAQYPSNHEDLITAMQSLPLAQLNSRGEADDLLGEHITDATLRAFLLQNLVRDETGFNWRINLDALQQSQTFLRGFPEMLANKTFEGPTLFLSGDSSDYIRPEHYDVMVRLFPGSKHSIVKDARHWVHADQPAAFIRETETFLL
jgi:esterase